VYPHTAYISVGSNLGNKIENCRNGIAALTRSAKTRLVDQSSIYRTEPVGYLDQDWFVNYVVKIETESDPLALLAALKSIEREAGRVKNTIRFGPRILDLDIILYDDLVLADPRLMIPHPRMHKRRFVLKPICDIDPEMDHPVLHRSMQSLLDDLAETDQRIWEYR
jgi:2-amino-4-hydroxy-6-hydroxymethyldihydropteridine diphosphokinase